tara:strand:+ start:196 stop:1071 length:876 start_codon:yes stop_codon:yes gene_type:complete
MIVILAPTAQLATDTLRLNPPPSLTVEAEYGAFVLEGTKYTAAHHQPIGSPYVGRHITPYGRPSPCNDQNIPKLEENEVALISHIDIDTIGGLMRATDEFENNGVFWFYAEHIDTNGRHKAKKDHPCWILYNGILAWIEDNKPEIDEKRNNDVTDFCYKAFDFIKSTLTDGHLATRMGHAYLYLQNKLDDSTFVEKLPCGLVVRRTQGKKVNHLYRDGNSVITYDEKYKSIRISTSDPIPNLSCRRLVQEWWGDKAGGHNQIAGSVRGNLMSEEDFKEATEKFVNEITSNL